MLIWTKGQTAPLMTVRSVVLSVILANALILVQTNDRCLWAWDAWSNMDVMKAISSACHVLSGSCQINLGPDGISSGGSKTLTPPLVRCCWR